MKPIILTEEERVALVDATSAAWHEANTKYKTTIETLAVREAIHHEKIVEVAITHNKLMDTLKSLHVRLKLLRDQP